MITKQYIAGFFDGEGSIGIYTTGKKSFHLRVQLVQGQAGCHILYELQSRFGGNVSKSKSTSGNDKFNWQLNSQPAMKFLIWLEPQLQLKKDQARIGIMWELTRPKMSRDAYGRIVPIKPSHIDREAAKTLKRLKKRSFDVNVLILELKNRNGK